LALGKKKKRIYKILISRISLSLFAYNIVSHINRDNQELQTLGGLFKNLECELHTLSIFLLAFMQILKNCKN